jgi:hypothetical protein
LSTAKQSAVGFTPSTVTTAGDGVPFLIGRMVHYNNPITAKDEFFTGKLAAVLAGFSAPNSVTFDWQLWETKNTGSGCCDDEITFTNQISNITLTQDGLTYRLVILGFERVGTSAACPATPGPDTKNKFLTKEAPRRTPACTPRCAGAEPEDRQTGRGGQPAGQELRVLLHQHLGRFAVGRRPVHPGRRFVGDPGDRQERDGRCHRERSG